MAEFIRARSDAQKAQRMDEIKQAADELFHERNYHEITLKGIAERLNWSHAALYKYVKTKEDIYLEVCADKRTEYFESLLTAYPEGCAYSREVLAEVWVEQLCSHRDYLAYSDLLFTIIETNVTVERLARFKSDYYADVAVLSRVRDEIVELVGVLGIELGKAADEAGESYPIEVVDLAADIVGYAGGNPSEAVEALLAARADARAAKDWALADAVRDGLAALGLRIMDTPQGQRVEVA